jgi:hypothetical protein
MANAPQSLSIRAYHVGFGDCFLLSFKYSAKSEKHVLIDFGTKGLPKGTPSSRMMDIALDIEKRSGKKLTAVVATHRHSDHISGFEPRTGGKGTGAVIRRLKPSLVIQPWTEDPDLATDAIGPADEAAAGGKQHVAQLSAMHDVARHIAAAGTRNRFWPKQLRNELSFVGENNIKNPGAVKNLMTMAKNEYVHAGSPTGLGKLLPGVGVTVLGPPTVKQSAAVKKEARTNPSEYWQFQANALSAAAGGKTVLFPRHVASKGPFFPVGARWFVVHARGANGDQSLQIVRMLDKAMNNTSVILLFRIGKSVVLFPGDAQYENWSYALGDAANQKLLKATNFYKVGHHGSLNATPKSLWKLFDNRSKAKKPGRLSTLLSTMPGKFGDPKTQTEVPRSTLVSELKSQTDLFSTEELTGPSFFHDVILTF